MFVGMLVVVAIAEGVSDGNDMDVLLFVTNGVKVGAIIGLLGVIVHHGITLVGLTGVKGTKGRYICCPTRKDELSLRQFARNICSSELFVLRLREVNVSPV